MGPSGPIFFAKNRGPSHFVLRQPHPPDFCAAQIFPNFAEIISPDPPDFWPGQVKLLFRLLRKSAPVLGMYGRIITPRLYTTGRYSRGVN